MESLMLSVWVILIVGAIFSVADNGRTGRTNEQIERIKKELRGNDE